MKLMMIHLDGLPSTVMQSRKRYFYFLKFFSQVNFDLDDPKHNLLLDFILTKQLYLQSSQTKLVCIRLLFNVACVLLYNKSFHILPVFILPNISVLPLLRIFFLRNKLEFLDPKNCNQ